jgi:hypothetical protein
MQICTWRLHLVRWPFKLADRLMVGGDFKNSSSKLKIQRVMLPAQAAPKEDQDLFFSNVVNLHRMRIQTSHILHFNLG